MRTITEDKITDLIAAARESPRKRTIYRLHEHAEPVQRMVNALVPGTYVTPHQHADPPKVELIAILRGRVAVLRFDDGGEIIETYILAPHSDTPIVEIAPGEWHTMLALEPSAVLEIVQGPYDAATHKQFAAFAPHEGQPGTDAYLETLSAHIRDVLKSSR